MIRLTVRDASGERTVACDRAEAIVGRREGVDVPVLDPAAGRHHCLLRIVDRKVMLIDLGSTNGTLVGGRKVEQAYLRPGDEFRIGNTTLRVDTWAGAPALTLEDGAETAAHPVRAPVPTGAGPDFGREIRMLLKRTPWYVISLAVHVLAIMVLDLVPFRVVNESIHRPMVAVKGREFAQPEADQEKFEIDLDELKPPEPDESELNEPEEASPEPRTAMDEALRAQEDLDRPKDIGTGSALSHRIRPLIVNPGITNPGERIDKGNLEGEHAAAKKAVERGVGTGLTNLRGIRPDRIVVIQGEFDKMENVLELYNIPHTAWTRIRFERRGSFGGARLLCINCSRQPSTALREKMAQHVKSFVMRGGWLITSDWSLEPYLTSGWPRYVRRHEPKRPQTRHVTVPVEAKQGDRSLLDGVFRTHRRPQWWLEQSSSFFKVVDRHRVHVLVESEEMHARYGSPAVVVEWQAGQGRVLHLLGHFYQKDGNRMGLVGMHRLIINYLRERFPTRGG